ncbi:hypothetical protein GVY41_09070 [Frigidibacter albus]|uniref:Uncharacterized protein n=1 Tax=Frigidibacter albus TaxID=1465486 RepID=A0A6L8VG67_9RHOB|nr:hypothetical protein [Frigidibacter albus]MZQ89243.1 hypothetical protein [Frigidibacter albus]NBE31149.1 hypothetical protein [Frigidibacter albus]GGH53138.1 hypothetical protein GCM10011341_18320 [Frigidibacter albus]
MIDLPTKTNLRATTKLACEIANTNPDRFNEAIHAGFYPCAPKTTPGKARSFSVDDIVALRQYQGEMDRGMSAAAAGAKACKILDFMQVYPDAPRVFIVATSFGSMDRLLPEFDVTQGFIMINDKQQIDVIGCEVINLDWHRVRIVHYITEADSNRVVGD